MPTDLLALINDIIRFSELDREIKAMSPFEEVDLYEVAKECLNELLVNAKLKKCNYIT